MSKIQDYLEGVNKHIFLFRASAIAVNRRIGRSGLLEIIPISTGQIKNHDLSKFEEPELSGYANYFPEKREEHKPAFLQAVQHHYTHNEHHPEYWQMRQGTMPAKYLTEMWADWMAASYQYSGSWDMSEWLNKNLMGIGGNDKFNKMFNHEQMKYIVELATVCGYVFSYWPSYGMSVNKFHASGNVLIPDIGI